MLEQLLLARQRLKGRSWNLRATGCCRRRAELAQKAFRPCFEAAWQRSIEAHGLDGWPCRWRQRRKTTHRRPPSRTLKSSAIAHCCPLCICTVRALLIREAWGQTKGDDCDDCPLSSANPQSARVRRRPLPTAHCPLRLPGLGPIWVSRESPSPCPCLLACWPAR